MGAWNEAVRRLTPGITMETCDCICHREQGVVHAMACCEACACGQRIRNGMMDLHKVHCKQVPVTADVVDARRLMGLGQH